MTKTKDIKAVRVAAAEDLKKGDYVTVSKMTLEMVPMCQESFGQDTIHPLRVQLTPYYSGCAFKVRAICVPYVMVIDCDGDAGTLDLRRHHLVKLAGSFGRQVFKHAKDQRVRDRRGRRKR